MTHAFSTAEVAERFMGGETMAFIAKDLGCTTETIRYRLTKVGIRSKGKQKADARAMLDTHRPVLSGLLGQLSRAVVRVRAEFAENAGNREKRNHYKQRIKRLQDQIFALESITMKGQVKA